MKPRESTTESHTASTTRELIPIATRILNRYAGARIFALTGSMGAGKTALIHAFLRVLDVEDRGASPTFSLVNEYRTKNGGAVYHFDFYRIESTEEVYDIGYEMYFYGGNYCFVEWAEKVEELLPEDAVRIAIKKQGDRRMIRVEGPVK